MGTPSKKIPSKIFEKPLDKSAEMWYNNNVKRGTQTQRARHSGQADTKLSRTVRTDSLGLDSETILLSAE
jgi:hypothetical protein